MSTATDHTIAALDALRSAGLLVDSISFDGVLHRVPTADKPNGKDGAYIAHGDAPASLWCKNWRSGEENTWSAKGADKLTAVEREALTRRMEENRKAREEPHYRYMRRAHKIRDRLGGDRWYIKPKGMHQRTFDRLVDECHRADELSWRAAAVRLGIL